MVALTMLNKRVVVPSVLIGSSLVHSSIKKGSATLMILMVTDC